MRIVGVVFCVLLLCACPRKGVKVAQQADEKKADKEVATAVQKIVIDSVYRAAAYQMTDKRVVAHTASEYAKYGLLKVVKTIGMDFPTLYKETSQTFVIVGKVDIYPNLTSLIIYHTSIYDDPTWWLVNYDSNHRYIDSIIIYLDHSVGDDEGSCWCKESVIHLLPKPHIEVTQSTYYMYMFDDKPKCFWGDRIISRVEVLESGEFKVTDTEVTNQKVTVIDYDHVFEKTPFYVINFPEENRVIPADSIQHVERACLIEMGPQTREFEDEESEDTREYFAAIDGWAHYGAKTRRMVEAEGVESVSVEKRYLSFDVVNGDILIVDTKMGLNGLSGLMLLCNGFEDSIPLFIGPDDDFGIDSYVNYGCFQ